MDQSFLDCSLIVPKLRIVLSISAPYIPKPHDKLYESFSIFCPCNELDTLDTLADEDVLLDWSEPLYINFTHRRIMEQIERFYDSRGSMEKVAGDVYICSNPPDDLGIIEDLAEDARMLQLNTEHAQPIHDLYPANDMESVEVFEKLINALPAYGVFSSTGELAAWMVQSYYGAMFSMQTRPEFRRKGYGIHLAKYLTMVVKDRGYLPFVVIRPENDASKSLYTKLGFKKNFETVRAILQPYGESHEKLDGDMVVCETVLHHEKTNGKANTNGDVNDGPLKLSNEKRNGEDLATTFELVHENGDCSRNKSN